MSIKVRDLINNRDWVSKPIIENEHPRWRTYANCKDASKNTFVTTKGQSLKPALALCSTCVVSTACLNYALDNNCVGIWGNTTAKQRAKIKRQQRLSNAE